jgi:colanic acid/amylovoran biosynthesis glycosyltransferase
MDKPSQFHILVVRYGNDPVTFLNRLLIGLANEKIQVTIAADRKSLSRHFTNKNINVLWAPSWKDSFFHRALNIIRLLLTRFSFKRTKWLFHILKREKSIKEKVVTLYKYLPFMKEKWDLIYFPWNGSAVDYLGLFELGIPTIVSCRGSQINIKPITTQSKGYVDGLKESLKKATAIHCVSQDILDQATRYDLDPKKAIVIRPAVDPDFFSEPLTRNQNHRFTIVTTGALIWRKCYESLLMAVRKLVDTGIDAELHIIGTGEDQQRLLYTIEDLNLSNYVFLQGYLPPDQVCKWLQKADAFVLSSLSEGISNAVLEAMSCGLPVVTTDCGGMQEAIENEIEGLIVPVWDECAIAEALLRLTKSEDLRKKMGAAGRKRIIREFNLDHQIANFKQLIHKATC